MRCKDTKKIFTDCTILQKFHLKTALFCKFQTLRLHYFTNFKHPNCTILQILDLQTALFCKFWASKLHYFANFGLANCTILQILDIQTAVFCTPVSSKKLLSGVILNADQGTIPLIPRYYEVYWAGCDNTNAYRGSPKTNRIERLCFCW